MRWGGCLAIAALATVACGSSESAPGQGPGSPSGPTPGGSSDDGGGGSGPTGGNDGGPGGTDGCVTKEKVSGDQTWKIAFGGTERTVDVHVPSSYDPATPTPVVLNFHGLASTSSSQIILSKMKAKSDAAGFVAVHPQGTSNSWNAGVCCGAAASSNVDDVGFVRVLLDELQAKLCVDRRRVFATGMSNGGFFSHRLACEMSDRIAAIAPVAGLMGVGSCSPTRPMSVLQFHGTSDSIVPYEGNGSLFYPSVATTIEGWVSRSACSTTPEETYRNGDSHCDTFGGCAGGAEVRLCTVDDGGHTWPGGTPVSYLGKTTTDISATDVMWEFFQAHPMP